VNHAAAHARNLAGPILRGLYRPAVVNVDALPREGGTLLAVAGDAGVRMPLNGTLPRPVVEIVDGPWPEWASALGGTLGVLVLSAARRARLHAAAARLADEAFAYRVHTPQDWEWIAYVHMRSGVPVVPVALLAQRRPIVHVGTPCVLEPAADRAGLRRVAEAVRQHTTDHVRMAQARVGR